MKIFRIILAAWMITWLFFNIRSLVVEKDISTLKDYINLASVDWEGKRTIVFGEDQYKFLRFCKVNLPDQSRYKVTRDPCGNLSIAKTA